LVASVPFSIFSDTALLDKFREAWIKTGKKLDMGKSCVRFKKIEDVPLKVIADTIRRVNVKKFIERYESVINPTPAKKTKTKKRTV
jgi:Domain of unknown function (DU1801)